MTSGTNHDRGCIQRAIALASMSASFSIAGGMFPGVEAGMMALGSLSGLWLSPDLDTYSRPYYRWEHIWLDFIWEPYRQWVPHRSVVSHLPVLSTGIRVAWLATWLAGLTTIVWLGCSWFGVGGSVSITPEQAMRTLERVSYLGWHWLVGLAMADAVHWVLDGFPVHLPRKKLDKEKRRRIN